MACRFVTREDWLRERVEQHVRQLYERAHGAIVRTFPNLMVADLDAAAVVRCAAGLRQAADGFFSECYVERTLEDALSALARQPVGRDRIIEVTSLASLNVCALVRLIRHIVAYARDRGIDWAVFTITWRLKELLCRMNLPLVVLCPAERARVERPDDWGRYYESSPVVTVLRDSRQAAIGPPPRGRPMPGLGARRFPHIALLA